MAINPALLAHSLQSSQPTAQGILGDVAALKNLEGRNQLLGLNNQITQRNISEYDANAPVRGLERQNALKTELLGMANDFVNIFEQGGKEPALGYLASANPTTPEAVKIRDEAIAALQSPDPQDDIDVLAQAKGLQQSLMGQQNQQDGPADVQTYKFFAGLPPEAQKTFMNLKRGGRVVTIGGVPHFVDQNGVGTPINTPEGMANLQSEISAAQQLAGAKETGTQGAQIAAIPEKVATETSAQGLADAPGKIDSAQAQMSSIDQTLDQVSQALGLVGPTTTGWGNWLKFLPSTDARALRTKIDTIKANLAFDKLQSMRDLSKTGGALGQVSERELNLLESSVTSLDQGLSDDALKANLENIAMHYSNARYVLNKIIDVQSNLITEAQARQDVDQLALNARKPPKEPEAKVIDFSELPSQ